MNDFMERNRVLITESEPGDRFADLERLDEYVLLDEHWHEYKVDNYTLLNLRTGRLKHYSQLPPLIRVALVVEGDPEDEVQGATIPAAKS